ncbi:hypothetical protein OESDEN_06235 [Oesophagostomum dentatum]|uniref:Uncharacterized protein n=1 Tax=Oesophagostomum dentatum TaxID=61180 RepID=A0A0B1T9C4_OESDE|nr:hypothetical protein OESDEN_06235 [Oesophagostomum dentatum]
MPTKPRAATLRSELCEHNCGLEHGDLLGRKELQFGRTGWNAMLLEGPSEEPHHVQSPQLRGWFADEPQYVGPWYDGSNWY